MPDDFPLRDGLVAHMRLQADLQDELHKYFYFKSPTWKAIIREVSQKKRDNGLVVIPKDMHIPTHRGTGPAMSFKGAWMPGLDYLPGGVKKEQDYFGIRFVIGYVYDDDDSDMPNEKEKTYDLNVPTDIELNFTQDKFDAWVATVKAERDKFDRDHAKMQLDEIRLKFPDLF